MKEIVVQKNKRKRLVFKFEEIKERPNIYGTSFLCYHHCSYGPSVCLKLPDPRNNKDHEQNFMNFCADIEGDYIPVPGSLERLYGRMIKKIKEED